MDVSGWVSFFVELLYHHHISDKHVAMIPMSKAYNQGLKKLKFGLIGLSVRESPREMMGSSLELKGKRMVGMGMEAVSSLTLYNMRKPLKFRS